MKNSTSYIVSEKGKLSVSPITSGKYLTSEFWVTFQISRTRVQKALLKVCLYFQNIWRYRAEFHQNLKQHSEDKFLTVGEGVQLPSIKLREEWII